MNEGSALPAAGRREWLGLAVIALPCLLYSMDLSVLNLALPELSADLKPSSTQLLWIVDIYGFMVAGSLVTMGTLGDRIGRRRLLLLGAAAFSLTSVVAAFSRSAEMLIAMRALLGISGATLAPSTLSLIRNMFMEPKQRTVAIGVWVTCFSVGGAIGPLLGGLLLRYFWWGSVFLIGVPVMLLLLIVGPLLLPEFKDPGAGSLDLLSAGESLCAVLLVIYGLKRIAEHGLGWWPASAMAVGIGIGIAFVRRQRALPQPFLDLGLFRTPAFSASLATYTLGTFVAFGAYLFIAQYLQLVLGLSPPAAGLATAPSMVAFIVGGLVVPILARHLRAAQLVAFGFFLTAIGFMILTRATAHSGLIAVILGSVIYSLGLSPVVILATDLIVGNAPVERAGAASAISETSAELGGALGVAILGSIGVAAYRSSMRFTLPAGVPSDPAQTAIATLGGALAVAKDLPPPLASLVTTSARTAFARAFALTAWISAAIAFATVLPAWILLRRSRSGRSEPESASENKALSHPRA